MIFPDAQTYCFQFCSLMTQAFSLKAQAMTNILNKELKRIDIYMAKSKHTDNSYLKNSLYDVSLYTH